MNSGIYAIINVLNDKHYIGSAINFKNRWSEHLRDLKNKQHGNKHLQNSWNVSDAHNFIFIILEVCQKENLLEREQLWINKLQPEYNIRKTANSNLGLKFSEEHKAKISAAHKGKPKSLEHRSNLAKANIGKTLSEEQKLKIGRASKLKTRSELTRIKASISMKGKNRKSDKWPCPDGWKCRCNSCKYQRNVLNIYNRDKKNADFRPSAST